jgi:hypothetical protein
MSEPSNAEIGRRERWAAQENQRRQAEYAQADLAWTRDDQLFDWMVNTARSGTGFHPEQIGSSFVTKRGESLFGAFNGCRLIEVKRGAGTYQGGYSGFSFRVSRGISYHVGGSRGTFVQGSEQLQITDEGEAVVTNKRVVFQGGLNSREWAFNKLISVQHDPSKPISLIHVSNRQKVSGISYPADQAAQVRFALELGAAIESGSTWALVGSLQTERAEHASSRPAAPAIAAPEDAPSRAAAVGGTLMTLMTGKRGQSPRRRVLHTVVAVGLALFLLNVGMSSLTGNFANNSPQAYLSAPATTLAPAPNLSATPVAAPPATAPAPTVDSPSASPTIAPDEPVQKVKVGPKPTAPRLLPTRGTPVRVGATCKDGSESGATGRGACSWHGGVRVWLYEQPSWVYDNKEKNASRTRTYKAALKSWKTSTARNQLLSKYPCSKGPYPEGSHGYASWRDTNDNGIACDR